VVLIPETNEDEAGLERLADEDEIGSASSFAELGCEAHLPRWRTCPKLERRVSVRRTTYCC
jgi:hypothetical protein